METVSADVTIVGSGIAGLWSAKELVDQGLSVVVVEKDPMLAAGATTRNEGWLHAGTYHSQAIENETDALLVTKRTVYGHQDIVRFAPESIDHRQSYAFTSDESRASSIVDRWDKAGVQYQQVAPASLEADGIDTSRFKEAFSVADKSVNSVALCQKLAGYIASRGGKFITGATLRPVDDTRADIVMPDNIRTIRSDRFVVTAGAGIKEFVEELTGEALMMRYFQAHLLVMPRLTHDNYFYLDVGEAGVMNHGDSSIIGINRDGIELTDASYAVDPQKMRLIYDALARLVPSATDTKLGSPRITAVACCKPDIYKSHTDTQSLNIQIMEPSPNYICAMPGKMTEAPFLAKEVVRYIFGSNQPLTASSELLATAPPAIPQITLRPADVFMQRVLAGAQPPAA